MHKKFKIFSIGLIGFLIGITTISLLIKSQINDRNSNIEFHEHANFLLMIDGVAKDFSLPNFMSIKPCITEAKTQHFIEKASAHGGHENKALTDIVHLHSGIGTTIHAHIEGVTYSEFFASIGMTLNDNEFIDEKGVVTKNTTEKSFRYFLNNKEIPSVKDMPIRNLDFVLITYGNKNRTAAEINAELVQVPHDACRESGDCKHRGIAPPEECGEAIKNPWLLRFLGI